MEKQQAGISGTADFRYFKMRRVNQTLWIELHHPPVNFLTIDICTELHRIFKDAERDESLRVLALTGGIEDRYIFHFSIPEIGLTSRNAARLKLAAISRSRLLGPLFRAGTALTLGLMRRYPAYESLILGLARLLRKPLPAIHLLLQMNATYFAIENSHKLTIAAINGTCNGGGTEMGACFDFRFMVGDSGFTIGQPEALLGIVAGGGGTQRVTRLIGKAKALEFMLLCDQWSAQQAKQNGLITDHFPKAEFHASVQAFADRMSRRSAVALFETRRAVNAGLNTGISRGLAEEMSATLHCCADTGTQKAIVEYTAILDETVYGWPNPAQTGEIVKCFDEERMTRHFSHAQNVGNT